MKLNCGPTKETIRNMRAKRAAQIWDEGGEIVFAWQPIRMGDNDCRWLEKVRRVPDFRNRDDFIYSYKHDFIMDWKYEPIQPK